jgi:uncharacterized protein involved in exopolysaccharide biosynthesis
MQSDKKHFDEPRHAVLMFVDEDRGSGSSSAFFVPLFVAHWRLIASSAVVAAIAALVYCLMTPKWYRAEVVIAAISADSGGSSLSSLGGQLGGIASLVGVDLGNNEDQKKENLARLSSREFIYTFLREQQLLPVLFPNRWNAGEKRWNAGGAQEPTLEKAYRYFTENVFTISEDRRTGLIKIAVDWKSPQLAGEWANLLVARINADRREVARAEAERSLAFLNKELGQTSLLELRQTINRLLESEFRKAMLVNVREDYAFKVVDPAITPGEEAVVWPRRVMLIVLAAILGTLCGFAPALLFSRLRPLR